MGAADEPRCFPSPPAHRGVPDSHAKGTSPPLLKCFPGQALLLVSFIIIIFYLPSSTGLLRFKGENSVSGRSDSNQKGKVFFSHKPFSLFYPSVCFLIWGRVARKAEKREKLIVNSTKDLFPPDSDRIKFLTANSSHLPLLFEKRFVEGRGGGALCNQRDKEISCKFAPFFAGDQRDRSRESWSSPAGNSRCWSSDRSQPFP